MDALGATLTEDLIVNVPGAHPLSGQYKSRDDFFQNFFGKVMAQTEGRFALFY